MRFRGPAAHPDSYRDVELEEIKNVGECWANYRGPERRKKAGRTAAACFTYVAKKWFRFHVHLVVPSAPLQPSDELIRDFGYLRSERGLSSETIRGYSWRAGVFCDGFRIAKAPLPSGQSIEVCWTPSCLAGNWC